MVRKGFMRKPKSHAADAFEIFAEYLKSNFIVDLISTVPNVFSFLNTQFAFLKIIRVYEVDMLHFSMNVLARRVYIDLPASQKDDIEFALSTVCKITILLHYLSSLWIYIGGPAYLHEEPGYLPWQFANEDFLDMDYAQLYIFSTYWVCTVITTVGYGDYSGGTTIEYQVTLFFEVFGLVIFSMLQISVTRVIDNQYSYTYYIQEKEREIDMWLLSMEKSS